MRQKQVNKLPTLVSLFTGAGGLDLGLETIGFQTVSAVDVDPDCVATLQANKSKQIPIASSNRHFLAETRIVQANIEELAANDLRVANATRYWRPDLLAGGPPCQPFSSAGKQLSLHDPRGRLFEHFVRIAAELKPRFVLFENVRGLVTAPGPSGEPGEALSLVRSEFERIGYGTTFALVNSADFGAPQRRVRLIMLGARQVPLPRFPEPTHCEKPMTGLFGVRKPWATLGEFLSRCPTPKDEEIEIPSSRLADLLAQVRPGSGLKSPGARETTRPGGHWGYKQGTFVADTKKPARTVTAAATQDWIWDADRLRRLTWRECAGLQGFPKDWVFVGNKASCFRQIGNAVPSVLGVVLGRAVIEALRNPGEENFVPVSEAWPASFKSAFDYTRREHLRNGDSRRAARAALAEGREPVHRVKGLGSADNTPTSTG